MLKPKREHVLVIANYTDQEFGRWLHSGFHAYFLEKKGRFAFRPMHTFIGIDFDLIQDLVAIFDQLEISERSSFRGGIAIALAKTELNSDTLMILDALLNLAAVTEADDVLDVLVDKLRSAWLSNSQFGEGLFGLTLRTILALAKNAGPTSLTQHSVDCLIQLAKSVKFSRAYAEALLVQLCRLRPNHLHANLALLRPHLDPELETTDVAADEEHRDAIRRRIIEHVLDFVSVDDFARSLDPSLRREDPVGRDWWVDTILSPQKPVILPTPSEDPSGISVIIDRNGQKSHASIDRNIEFGSRLTIELPLSEITFEASNVIPLGPFDLCFPHSRFGWSVRAGKSEDAE